MIPIEDFDYCMDREQFDYAGQLLVQIIDCAIGHRNNKPALEIERYDKNWTTAPFNYVVRDMEGGIGIW